MTPPILPSGLQRGISFTLPDNWTPAQALAVFELLDDLRQVVADHYMIQIQALLQEQRQYANCALDSDKPF
jgi:hypothetical protein